MSRLMFLNAGQKMSQALSLQTIMNALPICIVRVLSLLLLPPRFTSLPNFLVLVSTWKLVSSPEGALASCLEGQVHTPPSCDVTSNVFTMAWWCLQPLLGRMVLFDLSPVRGCATGTLRISCHVA